VGTLGAELFMTRIALLATLAGILLFTYGRAHAKPGVRKVTKNDPQC